MFPPDDAARHRTLWLDWWCSVRWRTLLTWILLAALPDIVAALIGWNRINAAAEWQMKLINRFSPVPLSGTFELYALFTRAMFAVWWFEPWLLRLNLWRAIVYLVLRTAPAVMLSYPGWVAQWLIRLFPTGGHTATLSAILLGFLPAAAVTPILWRWRSRPWMCVVGGLLAGIVAWLHFPMHNNLPDPLVSIPFAAALVYGTRLLRPEERARS